MPVVKTLKGIAPAGAGPVFIVGCGDVGLRVAVLEMAAGNPVTALVRSAVSGHAYAGRGIGVVRGDLDAPATLTGLPAADVLYYFAPPPEGEGEPRLAGLLAALAKEALPRRLVYISTSGVYGDCRGAWVDEDWPVNPLSERARRRLAAERMLRQWGEACGVAYTILRVPAIYGPGRLPVARIRQRMPVLREDESPWSNRIHVDDLARACRAAARHGVTDTAYNVSDGHPTKMTNYFYALADHFGLPRPPAISLVEARRTLDPGMLSFLEESKRLDNRRMLEELGVRLDYPDLASGLSACLDDGRAER